MVMTREEARGITVRQLLYYMGEQEIIQVCFKDDEWDEFVEMPSTSKFLIPFIDCRIDCIGAEKMEYEDGVAIRISIDESGVKEQKSIIPWLSELMLNINDEPIKPSEVIRRIEEGGLKRFAEEESQ